MFPVVLRGDTIELRELRAEDAPSIATVIADETVLRFTTWSGPTDLEAAESFVHLAQEAAVVTPRVEYLLAIVLPTGEVVGTGGLRYEDPDGEVGSLRCLLRRDWWGHGVATEAARLAIDFGFNELGMRRIEADPALDNVAAHRVLEKAGMRRLDARREQHLSPSGALRDSVGYVIERENRSP